MIWLMFRNSVNAVWRIEGKAAKVSVGQLIRRPCNSPDNTQW